jgi:hypothetical protein
VHAAIAADAAEREAEQRRQYEMMRALVGRGRGA